MGQGSKSSSSQKTYPMQMPYQQSLTSQYMQQYVPGSIGRPTEFSRQQEQMAGDQAARALATGQEQLMQNAGMAGIGAPEVANLQRSQQESAVQSMINQVLQARKDYAIMAMKMIAGQPLHAQTSSMKQSSASGGMG